MNLKDEVLASLASKTAWLQWAEQEYEKKYNEFLEALLDAYDRTPKQVRPTHQELAKVTGKSRGRVAQLLMKARKS